jgi:hypothetical protein
MDKVQKYNSFNIIMPMGHIEILLINSRTVSSVHRFIETQ